MSQADIINALSRQHERVKALVLQYVMICKLLNKHKELLLSKVDISVEDKIKKEKLLKSYDLYKKELLVGFEDYFKLEREAGVPVNFSLRSSYKRIKDLK